MVSIDLPSAFLLARFALNSSTDAEFSSPIFAAMVAIAFVITGSSGGVDRGGAITRNDVRLRVYHNVGLVVWLRGLRRLRIHNDVRLRVYYNVGLVMLKG